MYEIRICRSDEKPLLLNFLHDSWSHNHIFLRDESVLQFQHLQGNYLNFAVAYHVPSKSFHGVLGFISPSFYIRGKVSKGDELWLALWKVEKNLAENNSLGLDLLKYLEERYEPKRTSAIGINDQVANLYRLIGFKLATMNQWFIPNPQKTEFRIGHNLHSINSNLPRDNAHVNISENSFEDFGDNLINFKEIGSKSSKDYIIERYAKHPRYLYQCLLFHYKKDLIGAAVGRSVTAKDSSAFRITDLWIKETESCSIGCALQKFLIAKNLEYVDFVEFGWSAMKLQMNGFSKSTVDAYVPHLFEPFVHSKVEVKLAYRGEEGFKCTKADSDLDRPNI